MHLVCGGGRGAAIDLACDKRNDFTRSVCGVVKHFAVEMLQYCNRHTALKWCVCVCAACERELNSARVADHRIATILQVQVQVQVLY